MDQTEAPQSADTSNQEDQAISRATTGITNGMTAPLTSVEEPSKSLQTSSTLSSDLNNISSANCESERSCSEPPAHLSETETSTNVTNSEAPISKRQQKRLAKRASFLVKLPELRKMERVKRREKRAALAAAGNAPKKPRLTSMAEGGCDIGVCVDLSFDDLMEERDIRKCLKQVQRCYAANRRSSQPLQFHLSSMEGASLKHMECNDGWRNWDVHVHSEHFSEVLEKDKVTYLTSDSPDVLERLEPGRTYIIGGLVDHNHHKGICYDRAQTSNLATACLPIDEFLQMRTRKVLTIDHVFAILLHVAEGRSWEEAFCTVLPARKGAVLKDTEAKEKSEKCDTVDGARESCQRISCVTETAHCDKDEARNVAAETSNAADVETETTEGDVDSVEPPKSGVDSNVSEAGLVETA